MSRSVALTQDSSRLRSKSITNNLIPKTRGKNLLSNNYESKPSYNYTRILSVLVPIYIHSKPYRNMNIRHPLLMRHELETCP